MKQFRLLFGVAAIISLGLCLAAPILYFTGATTEEVFKETFLGATVAWFVCAWLWARPRGEKAADESA